MTKVGWKIMSEYGGLVVEHQTWNQEVLGLNTIGVPYPCAKYSNFL